MHQHQTWTPACSMSNIKRSSDIFFVYKYEIPSSSEWKREQNGSIARSPEFSPLHRESGFRDFASRDNRRDERRFRIFIEGKPRGLINPIPWKSSTRRSTFTSSTHAERRTVGLSLSPSWWRVHLPRRAARPSWLSGRPFAHTNCYRIISSALALGSGQRKLLRRISAKKTHAIKDSSSTPTG
jgi:hypothetical protein